MSESKRPPGRPPRQDDPQRLVARIPGELKKWLRHRAVEEQCDMGEIVAQALVTYRRRPEVGKGKR